MDADIASNVGVEILYFEIVGPPSFFRNRGQCSIAIGRVRMLFCLFKQVSRRSIVPQLLSRDCHSLARGEHNHGVIT